MSRVINSPSGAPIILEDDEDLSSPLPPVDCNEDQEEVPEDVLETSPLGEPITDLGDGPDDLPPPGELTSLGGAPILDGGVPDPDDCEEPPPPPPAQPTSLNGAPILD